MRSNKTVAEVNRLYRTIESLGRSITIRDEKLKRQKTEISKLKKALDKMVGIPDLTGRLEVLRTAITKATKP